MSHCGLLLLIFRMLMLVAGKEASVIIPGVPGQSRGAKSRTKLGEGAHWDEATRTLLWIDIVKGKIFTYDPATRLNTAIDMRQPVGTVVPHTADTLLCACIKGVVVVNSRVAS